MNSKILVPIFISTLAYSNGYFNLPMEEVLKLKVRSANRSEESVHKSTSNITVFERSQIERMGLKTLEELLRFVPGFYVSNLGDRGSITVRGSKSYSNVLLLVDGERLNDSMFGGFSVMTPEFSLSNAQRVEVIRGPGSTMYGANAFYGVINIISNKKEKRVSVELGNSRSKNIEASTKINYDELAIFLHSNYYSDEDYEYKSYRDSIISGSGTTVTNRNIPKAKESKERIDINIYGEYKNIEFGLFHSKRKFEGGSYFDGKAANSFENISKPSMSYYYLKGLLKNSKKEKLESRLSYREGRFNPRGYNGTKGGDGFSSGGNTSENSYRFTTDYSINLDDLKIVSGYEYINLGIKDDDRFSTFFSDGTYAGGYVSNGALYPNAPRQKIHGVYTQVQKSKGNHILTAGVRYDSNSLSGDDFSPRASYVYAKDQGVFFKLIYGHAYRSPTYGETHQNASSIKGNPNVKSEKIKTSEVVVGHSKDKYRTSLTFFNSKIEDQINAVQEGSIFTFRNNAEEERNGIEFEGTFFFTKNFYSSINFSHIFGLKATTLVAPDPYTLASFDLNYIREKFSLNLNAFWHNRFEGISEQGSVLVINTKISYAIDKKSKFYVLGKNIGDKEFLNTTFVRTNHQTNRGMELSAGYSYVF